jgi:hypothetical protein
MQRRERILLLIVAGLAVAIVGGLGANWAVGTLRARRLELKRLEAEAGAKPLLEVQLQDLDDRRMRLAQRSLPPQVEAAKTAYAQWLAQLVHDPSVSFSPVNIQTIRDAADQGFTRLVFQVDGDATYPQFINFLEKFYASDHLHKITNLKMPLGKDAKKLNINLTIEALALPGSENKQDLSKRAFVEHSAEQLQADVAQLMLRHFYRANQPPRLAMPSSVPVTVGRSVRIPLAGSDPDGDKVSYAWVSGPEWLKLEGTTLLSTTNPAEGSYEVAVSVTDDGVPAKSATQKFTIRVQPAPVPPKREVEKKKPFDHLRFTFLEGLLQRGDTPEAKITVRTLGKYDTLFVGDERDVGGIKFKVLDIDVVSKSMEILLPDNRRRTVQLGKSLGE